MKRPALGAAARFGLLGQMLAVVALFLVASLFRIFRTAGRGQRPPRASDR